MSDTITVTIGSRTFELDKTKAEEAFAAKQVINGRETMFFNILPLRYQWAYDQYRIMKNNHWEPEDIIMQKDIEQWRGDDLSDVERWIVKMAIGYFSAAEGIVGDNILHVVRQLVTAPELKLMLGRHAHEENIHADSLVYMISSLGINPHECEAMFEDIPSIKAKTDFVVSNSQGMRADVDLTTVAGRQALAKNIFLFGQVMEGTQFYGLFAMVLGLYRQNKFPGIGSMFRYTLRDECVLADHQLLTRNNYWKNVNELAPNDEVAQYHEDGSITFTPFGDPTVSEVDHTWHFTNEQGHLDLQVSANHRMVMRTIVAEARRDSGRESRCKIEIAENCRHNPYSAHICAGRLRSAAGSRTLTHKERFLIAFQADGHTPDVRLTGERSGNVLVRFTLKRARKIERLAALCAACGYAVVTEPLTARPGTVLVTVTLPAELLRLKRFGWVGLSEIDATWCADFIEELSYWDGHRVAGGDNRITWGNTNKEDVDIVQTIAVLAGYRTHYKFIEDTRYEPSAIYHRLQIVRNRDYFRGNKITKTKVEGKQLVYGVTVPSGMLLVRRNNAIGVTGNSGHIKGLRLLLREMIYENPEIMTEAFKQELLDTMAQGVELEKQFIRDCLPVAAVGLNVTDFEMYIDYIADRRLADLGFPLLHGATENPFPWMAEMIDIKKETNFFEGRVTDYQKSSALAAVSDDEL